MIVHFAAASPTFEKNLETYRKIIKTIQDLGHTRPRGYYDDRTQIEMAIPGALDDGDFALIGKRIFEQVEECEAAIFDVTDKSTFGIGYEAALTLGANKPTLFLLRKGSLRGAIITGLRHPSLTRSEFDEGTIETVVSDFLRKVSGQ